MNRRIPFLRLRIFSEEHGVKAPQTRVCQEWAVGQKTRTGKGMARKMLPDDPLTARESHDLGDKKTQHKKVLSVMITTKLDVVPSHAPWASEFEVSAILNGETTRERNGGLSNPTVAWLITTKMSSASDRHALAQFVFGGGSDGDHFEGLPSLFFFIPGCFALSTWLFNVIQTL